MVIFHSCLNFQRVLLNSESWFMFWPCIGDSTDGFSFHGFVGEIPVVVDQLGCTWEPGHTSSSRPFIPSSATQRRASWITLLGSLLGCSDCSPKRRSPSFQFIYNWLVVWNIISFFHIIIGNHHPNWQTHIFFRGVGQPPTISIDYP